MSIVLHDLIVNYHMICYNVHTIIMMIDSLDRQLIDLLMQDARRTSEELARYLTVNSSTIRRRMKKLVEQGIIHIVAIPEPSEVNMFTEAIIAFDVPNEKINSVTEIYRKLRIDKLVKIEMENYFKKAIENLNLISVKDENKKVLWSFAEKLMRRQR